MVVIFAIIGLNFSSICVVDISGKMVLYCNGFRVMASTINIFHEKQLITQDFEFNNIYLLVQPSVLTIYFVFSDFF